jgi:hypothetical protein
MKLRVAMDLLSTADALTLTTSRRGLYNETSILGRLCILVVASVAATTTV